MGYWKTIIPEAGTNMVLSPVAQGALTTTYTVVGANTTITLSTTYSYFGYKSYYIVVAPATDNSGISLVLATLSNAIHYVTIRVRGGLPTAWDWSLDNATFNEPTFLGIEGDWYIFGYQFPAAQANGSTALKVYTKGAYACNYYIGHVQVEANTYATTPITGDRKGFMTNGYYWNGVPHESFSTRSAQERSGGKEVDLEDTYKFKVLYGDGSGMPPITHHTSGMALLPGALYQGHKVEPRVLDLVSATKATTVATVAKARKDFINAIKPDKVSPEQPVVFRYTGVNANKPVEFYGYYDSGMEFQMTSGIVDKPIARFICYDPFAYEVHSESKVLLHYKSIANSDYIVRRTDAEWYNISTDFNDTVRALEWSNGILYIGGAFTNVGAATGDYIVKWSPTPAFGGSGGISSLDSGATGGAVYALKRSANGDIYVGGNFTDLSSVLGTAYIGYWDISASDFAPVTPTSPNSYVNAITFGLTGILYIGGNFTNLGDANGDNFCSNTGGAWVSLGTGVSGGSGVLALATAPNGDIYLGGNFTTAGGAANNYISCWDVSASAYTTLGSGMDDIVNCIVIDKIGNVYAGGDFHTANSVSCAHIAKWNGKTFEPLGSGLNGACETLAIDDNGLLYAAGRFTTAGDLTVDYAATWNGTTWAHLPTDLPITLFIRSILPVKNDLYIGYDNSGTASGSGLTTVNNTGSATAYPVIKITPISGAGPHILQWIKNETTGDTLWCNYTLLVGETLTIDLTPGNRSIKSDLFGDVWRAVLRSSDLSSFRLLPGNNNITLFINSPDLTANYWMEWPITHWGADMVAA